MIINYNGIGSFKLQSGDFTLAFNPISKKSKHKETRFGANVTCVSIKHPDFNGVEETDAKNKSNFVIDGPGEYEVAGVFIKGVATEVNYDDKKLINTIYSVLMDNINIGFLGALGTNGVEGELRETLNTIDILFVPIGGEGVLDAVSAYKLAVKLGAKIIIPMCYGLVGEKDALNKFLKVSGSTELKELEKLTIKKSELEGKEGEVVVLKSL
ncbi:MAG: MBL fold metallo-hydrolase [Candidatus Pacebacteria bacterium]|nr:MBL fold metallo-hydrolase [Candidatus Paceibacterota bacterium]